MYREATDALFKILETDYKETREISETPIGERYVTRETRGVRDVIEQTWKRNVEITVIKRSVKKIYEYYNSMAEGALKSLTQIADSNLDLREKIKKTMTTYQSKPKEREEDIYEETLDEICSNPPDPEQDERWQDWTD